MPFARQTMREFAKYIHKLLRTDRDVNIAVGGMTGEGKSTFTTLLEKEYSEVSGTKWGFNHMTWSRKEMMEWIDGEPNSKPDPETGLKPGQMPEYSAILPDELFLMFYRRNWFDDDQIDAIATFNMCRDRHLLVAGNVPDFWDLDPAFTKRMRFYVYIPIGRGVAWVFQQEDNPFCADKWNPLENKKIFRKTKKPYACQNFVCEIEFPDWSPKEKREYLKIRNQKRVESIQQNKSEKKERYSNIKQQRDNLIRFMFEYNRQVAEVVKALKCPNCTEKFKKEDLHVAFSNTAIGEVTGISTESIRMIRLGLQ